LLLKRRTILGSTHPSTVQTMHELARNYAFIGKNAESIALHDEILRIHISKHGPQDRPQGLFWESFAVVLMRAAEFLRAEQILRESLEHYRKCDDSLPNRNHIANTLGFLALNELLRNNYEAAETLAREACTQMQIETQRQYYWRIIQGTALLGQRK